MTIVDDKYYTPQIEDLCIGYECEITYDKNTIGSKEEYWLPYRVDRQYFNEGDYAQLRTPYLTQEQVEKEVGDKFKDFNSNEKSISLITPKVKDTYSQLWINYSLEYKTLSIRQLCPSIPEFDLPREIITYYHGRCPSVNEFRKICKLLDI